MKVLIIIQKFDDENIEDSLLVLLGSGINVLGIIFICLEKKNKWF